MVASGQGEKGWKGEGGGEGVGGGDGRGWEGFVAGCGGCGVAIGAGLWCRLRRVVHIVGSSCSGYSATIGYVQVLFGWFRCLGFGLVVLVCCTGLLYWLVVGSTGLVLLVLLVLALSVV